MSRRLSETTINGVKYQTSKYNPTDALRMLTLMGQLLGGPLGRALGSFGVDPTESTLGQILDGLDGDSMGGAISSLFAGLTGADTPKLLEKVLKSTQIQITASRGDDGGTERLLWDDINIDRDFRDNLLDVFKVAEWVLRFNFENFSKELVREGKRRAALAQAAAAQKEAEKQSA